MAFLNAGITISLKDERSGESEVFFFEGGIASFVAHLNKNKNAIHEEVMLFHQVKGKNDVEIAMQYTDGYTELILPFANNNKL